MAFIVSNYSIMVMHCTSNTDYESSNLSSYSNFSISLVNLIGSIKFICNCCNIEIYDILHYNLMLFYH